MTIFGSGRVSYAPQFGSAQVDVSGSGTLAYQSGRTGNGLVTVQWLESDGTTRPLLAKPGLYVSPHFSPDGQKLAFGITEASKNDIWTYDLQRDIMTRLTFGTATRPLNAVWSPDGRYIAFRERRGIFWTRSDGSSKPQQLTESKNIQNPASFTPDGKRLAWQEAVAPFSLWSMSLQEDSSGLLAGKMEILLRDSYNNLSPVFSPDGHWLAYASNESGSIQVYVRAFPDRGARWQVSSEGGLFPVWSRNGRDLFFRSGDNRIMVASYTVKGDSFMAEKPRAWSEKRPVNMGFLGQTFDVAPDGKRLAVLMPVETPEAQQAQNHVIFLENFFDELKRKVPVK